ncbi:hypothetical protein WMZ97_16235 [Lentibacillus sp. N15]|uniref:hypothetical protein n=1 Tax=Lentibacillus songyuanensis TaxID=3136161 RepID=UPI0031B9CFFA
MVRILDIIHADDFNVALINLLIDLYSSNYETYFEALDFDEKEINHLSDVELDRLTKVAAVIKYIGNRQPSATLFDWIYSDKLKLDYPYTPGVPKDSIARVKRIFSAPKEFASRNVFYDEQTLKPV